MPRRLNWRLSVGAVNEGAPGVARCSTPGYGPAPLPGLKTTKGAPNGAAACSPGWSNAQPRAPLVYSTVPSSGRSFGVHVPTTFTGATFSSFIRCFGNRCGNGSASGRESWINSRNVACLNGRPGTQSRALRGRSGPAAGTAGGAKKRNACAPKGTRALTDPARDLRRNGRAHSNESGWGRQVFSASLIAGMIAKALSPHVTGTSMNRRSLCAVPMCSIADAELCGSCSARSEGDR